MRAVNNAGTVLGPPLGGLLAVHHFGAIFVIDAVASLLMLGVVLFVVPTAPRASPCPTAPRPVCSPRCARTHGSSCSC